MDVISRILDTIRVRAPLLAQFGMGGDVSVDMLEGAGSPFYYVVQGAARLTIGSSSTELAAGGLAIVPSWARHPVEHRSGGRPQTIVEVVEAQGLPLWSMKEGLDQPLTLNVGPAPHDTRILSGNFSMDPEEAGFLARSLPEVLCFSIHDSAMRGTLEATLELVLQQMHGKEPGFSAVAGRALELLFTQALRQWLLKADHPSGWARGIAHPQIRRALDAIYADPAREWRLEDLARSAGQSRATFASTFREIVGETPFTHLRRFRMRRAATLLRISKKSTQQIGAELGYPSSYSFIRAFDREMEMTPAAYRSVQSVR